MPAELALIVCGGRNWTDQEFIYDRLDRFKADLGECRLILIEGEALGADRIAGTWATREHAFSVEDAFEHIPMPAEWNYHAAGWCPGAWCALKRFCLGAGPRRNQAMIDRALMFERQYVLAFKDNFNLARGSGGTEDLVRRAISAQIPGLTIRHALVAAL